MTNTRIMSRRIRLCAPMTVLALAIAGCEPAMEVYSYWGPGLRFSETARAYAWAPDATRTTGEGRPHNPKVDELIRKSVEKHLALKGFEPADQRTPDFLIDYRVAQAVRGDAYGGVGFSDTTRGALALYVVNPNNSELIWRGIVQGALDESAQPEERVKRLDLAVKRMLDQVPSPKRAK